LFHFELPILFLINFSEKITKQSTTIRLNSFVLEYGTDIFKTDRSIQLCKLCDVEVNSDRKIVVPQHVNTEKHKRVAVKKNEKNTNSEIQQLVTNSPKKYLFSHILLKLYCKQTYRFTK